MVPPPGSVKTTTPSISANHPILSIFLFLIKKRHHGQVEHRRHIGEINAVFLSIDTALPFIPSEFHFEYCIYTEYLRQVSSLIAQRPALTGFQPASARVENTVGGVVGAPLSFMNSDTADLNSSTLSGGK
jgi:hypothetical protein